MSKLLPGTNRRKRRALLKQQAIPAKLARYYDTLDLAEQALNNSGESAKKILIASIESKEFKHLVEGEEVTRTLSATDITAILDALTYYDSQKPE